MHPRQNLHACMHACIACMHACMHAYIHTYIHTCLHIYMQTSKIYFFFTLCYPSEYGIDYMWHAVILLYVFVYVYHHVCRHLYTRIIMYIYTYSFQYVYTCSIHIQRYGETSVTWLRSYVNTTIVSIATYYVTLWQCVCNMYTISIIITSRAKSIEVHACGREVSFPGAAGNSGLIVCIEPTEIGCRSLDYKPSF